MNGFQKFLATTFLSASILFSSAAQAMQIQQFDKMANQDQDEYVAELVLGAQKVLQDSGRPDLAQQVHTLFTTKDPQGDISVGMTEFEITLARARVADAANVTKDPNAARLEVEHAMIVMLKKNGVILPPSFMTVASNFQPKFPPQSK